MNTTATALPPTSVWNDLQVRNAQALAQWLDERCGCLTASRMKDAMAYLKNGQPAQKRTDYLTDLLAERLTQVSTRHFVTDAMQWGLEIEAEARKVYQALTGYHTRPQEFIQHAAIENFGATPDGFIDGDGLLEIKCPTTSTFVEWRLAGVVPEEHIPQMTAQVLCTGRQWVDFFAFDPRIRDAKLNRFLRRFEPTQEQKDKVQEHAVRFLTELDNLFDQFVNAQ